MHYSKAADGAPSAYYCTGVGCVMFLAVSSVYFISIWFPAVCIRVMGVCEGRGWAFCCTFEVQLRESGLEAWDLQTDRFCKRPGSADEETVGLHGIG